ncbi:MAG TPA: glycosyltransferase family 9 protein [Verrucomicrobiae bacterium]|nr:glycosyltransferase family 9 protein [Verrucomicrobiae bacterium]
MKIFFEPWNLGDALIAASVARVAPDRIVLACSSRWHEVLRLGTNGNLRLYPLDLPYVWGRARRGPFDFGDIAEQAVPFRELLKGDLEIISIRGDFRDWIAARRLFPRARFSFTGWMPYLARRSSLFDLPFRAGRVPIRNRYGAWASAAGIPMPTVEAAVPILEVADNAPVAIHVGAQWRSKQYPHVVDVARLLEQRGTAVTVVAGPEDPLPPGMPESKVLRPKWGALVDLFRGSRGVIANDSGPMHLAAFLGCRTVALSRCSNLTEWLPPGVLELSSPLAPKGYRPVAEYWSDEVLPGWPAPEEVVKAAMGEKK